MNARYVWIVFEDDRIIEVSSTKAWAEDLVSAREHYAAKRGGSEAYRIIPYEVDGLAKEGQRIVREEEDQDERDEIALREEFTEAELERMRGT